MRLVDTSAWIEWLMASPTGIGLDALMPAQNEWLVPTIVQLELAKWLTRELGDDEADKVIAWSMLCEVAPLDSKIALHAADLCARHKLATADAIVYATALDRGAELLTCDAHFDGLAGVNYIAKTAP
jgi:predicted nucleic acid-binding protein